MHPLSNIPCLSLVIDFSSATLSDALKLRQVSSNFANAVEHFCMSMYARMARELCSASAAAAGKLSPHGVRKTSSLFLRISRAQISAAKQQGRAPPRTPAEALSLSGQRLTFVLVNMISCTVPSSSSSLGSEGQKGQQRPFLAEWKCRDQVLRQAARSGCAELLDMMLAKSGGADLLQEIGASRLPSLAPGALPSATAGGLHLPLIFDAVSSNRMAVVDVCLKYGANVDTGSSKSSSNSGSGGGSSVIHSSPLLFACAAGNEDMVLALLARGADPSRSNDSGFGPLAAAVSANAPGVIAALLADPKAAALKDAPSTKSSSKHTALTLALSKLHADAEVEALLFSGGGGGGSSRGVGRAAVDPNAPNGHGETPLQVACRCQKANPQIVGRLIRAGAHVNGLGAAPRFKFPPIAAAVQMRADNVIRVLVSHGASIVFDDENLRAEMAVSQYRSFRSAAEMARNIRWNDGVDLLEQLERSPEARAAAVKEQRF